MCLAIYFRQALIAFHSSCSSSPVNFLSLIEWSRILHKTLETFLTVRVRVRVRVRVKEREMHNGKSGSTAVSTTDQEGPQRMLSMMTKILVL